MSFPALQALSAAIRINDGGCTLLAHWDFDTYSDLPGDPDFEDGLVVGVEVSSLPDTASTEGLVVGVEVIPVDDTASTEGLVVGVEVTDAYWA